MEQEQPLPVIRSRRLLWGGVIVFLVLLVGSLVLVDVLRRLRPGEVVDEYGTYYSPRGAYRVTISEQPAAGFVKVVVQSKTNGLWIFSSYGMDVPRQFDIERDWMVCFDEYDRMWLFIGKWPGTPGGQRTLPGGGIIPDGQAVALQGFFFHSGKIVFGETSVSLSGAWEGVPPEFFARLPGNTDPHWAPGASVPAEPVSFTKAQLNRFR